MIKDILFTALAAIALTVFLMGAAIAFIPVVVCFLIYIGSLAIAAIAMEPEGPTA